QLVQLLNERATESLAIRGLKPQMHWGRYDPKREEEIFANLTRCNEGPLYAENLREIYEAILHVMKELRG
ncbi:MAG: chorismate mutase, partial [Dermatophilaceae bacterium]